MFADILSSKNLKKCPSLLKTYEALVGLYMYFVYLYFHQSHPTMSAIMDILKFTNTITEKTVLLNKFETKEKLSL